MSTAPPTENRVRHSITLAAVCLAVLILPASLTGTSVALPQIGTELHADLAPLQWVVNSYNLAFACFMLAFGSLADIVGRRRIFTLGTGLFAVATLVSAVTSDILVLDVARGLSGVGAAAVMTAGCAILATTFEGPALVKAFAILGSSAGAGLALGPSTAGFLVGTFGWRSVFISHLVLMVLVMAAIPLMRETKNPTATKVDWVGTLTFTLSLFFVMLGIVQGPQLGWGSGQVIGYFAAAAVLLVGFVVVEGRVAQPMFDISLFRQARFLAVCLVPVALSFGFVVLLVLLPSYFSGVGGFSVNGAGATMMLLTLPVLIVPLTVSRLVKLGLSNRVVLSASVLLVAIGAGWLTVLDSGVSIAAIVGPLLIIGIGMGVTAGLVDGVAITSVQPERAGMAAGMFNTMRLAGEALAIAIMSAVLVNETQSRLTDGIGPFAGQAGDVPALANQVASGSVPEGGPDFISLITTSYTGALHTVLWATAAICAVSAVVVYVLLRDPKPVDAPAEVVEESDALAAR